MTLAEKLEKCAVAIQDARYFCGLAHEQVCLTQDLTCARSELSNASNAIDDAMGIIDELLAPEPGPYDDPHLP
jgi:hypothetical protein